MCFSLIHIARLCKFEIIYNYLFPLEAILWVLLKACNFYENINIGFIKTYFKNDKRKKEDKFLPAPLRRWYYATMRLKNMHFFNVSCESLYTRERWDRFLRSAATTPLALILHIYNIDRISIQYSPLHHSMSCYAAAAIVVLTTRSVYKR